MLERRLLGDNLQIKSRKKWSELNEVADKCN